MLYPDSVVGTDSHTPMINGLGVVGWGVGGIEAEAVMLGETISMVLPKVVGFKLTGSLKNHVTATDLVLTCTEMLRKRGALDSLLNSLVMVSKHFQSQTELLLVICHLSMVLLWVTSLLIIKLLCI